MLTSLVVELKAAEAVSLPANLGRAGQALLLRLIAEQDADLAAQLHAGDSLRPLTASNLVMGRRAEGSLHLAAGQSGWLRFTGLTAAVSGCLTRLAEGPPQSVELDRVHLAVTGATLDPAAHPWAGQISYQDLAGRYLLGGQAPPPYLTLEFASPTTFRSGGKFLPLPLPELVFGSLLDRWQTFSPVALNPETRRFAAEAVALSRYRLRTRGMPYKRGGGGGNTLIGFSGQVAFRALNRDRYWLNVLHLLGAFAFYSGVGAQTGSGLGQTRLYGE